MQDYLKVVVDQLGVPIWLFIIIFAWSAVWKVFALWKSARKNSRVWFIILFLVNTIGILEILYIFVFSEMKFGKKSEKPKTKKRRKR